MNNWNSMAGYGLPMGASQPIPGITSAMNNLGVPQVSASPMIPTAPVFSSLAQYLPPAPAVTPGFMPPVAMPGIGDDLGIDYTSGNYGFGGGDLAAAAPTDWMGSLGNFFKGAIGTKDAPGWGGLALGGAQALSGAWMGMKQYGLAKESLAESKRQFNLNYNAQKQTTNTALEDRQRARVASNAGAYESVGSYMDKNSVK